jgi:nucleotide-binding universal stress UspA family protein
MKILVATGGSAHSDKAVLSGAEFAGATDSALTVLTVIKEPKRHAEGQAIVDRAVALARQVYDERGLAGAEVQIDTKIRVGHAAEEIVREAIEGSFDLVVVGTWPKQSLLNYLLAPTTERVIMQAPCPVLVAKGRLATLQHALLCVSGVGSPTKATRFLADLVSRMSRELNITVLHVMSQISAGPVIHEDWQLQASAERLMQADTPEGRWLRDEVETLKQTGARVQAKVRHGPVVDEVLSEALGGGCDLLIIGAHRQAGWQRYLLDDLAHQIVARAERPVLVV